MRLVKCYELLLSSCSSASARYPYMFELFLKAWYVIEGIQYLQISRLTEERAVARVVEILQWEMESQLKSRGWICSCPISWVPSLGWVLGLLGLVASVLGWAYWLLGLSGMGWVDIWAFPGTKTVDLAWEITTLKNTIILVHTLQSNMSSLEDRYIDMHNYKAYTGYIYWIDKTNYNRSLQLLTFSNKSTRKFLQLTVWGHKVGAEGSAYQQTQFGMFINSRGSSCHRSLVIVNSAS